MSKGFLVTLFVVFSMVVLLNLIDILRNDYPKIREDTAGKDTIRMIIGLFFVIWIFIILK